MCIKDFTINSFPLTLLCACLLIGCAGTSSTVDVKRSTFDDTVELTSGRGHVYKSTDGMSGAALSLSLFWSSRMAPDELIMEASVLGAENIADGESLHFNMDGDIYSFSSFDRVTNIVIEQVTSTLPANNVSSKRYKISIEFLDKVLHSKDVRVKLDLRTAYVAGIFTDSTAFSAMNTFTKFRNKLRELKNGSN